MNSLLFNSVIISILLGFIFTLIINFIGYGEKIFPVVKFYGPLLIIVLGAILHFISRLSEKMFADLIYESKYINSNILAQHISHQTDINNVLTLAIIQIAIIYETNSILIMYMFIVYTFFIIGAMVSFIKDIKAFKDYKRPV